MEFQVSHTGCWCAQLEVVPPWGPSPSRCRVVIPVTSKGTWGHRWHLGTAFGGHSREVNPRLRFQSQGETQTHMLTCVSGWRWGIFTRRCVGESKSEVAPPSPSSPEWPFIRNPQAYKLVCCTVFISCERKKNTTIQSRINVFDTYGFLITLKICISICMCILYAEKCARVISKSL